MTRYRLRAGVTLRRDAAGRLELRDAALRRVMRLGQQDGRLAAALAGKGTSYDGLRRALGAAAEETSARLSAFAALYLLDGKRAALQLRLAALQPPATAPQALPLRWLEGPDPPRHRCMAVGACCSSSFLGPMTAADRERVVGLKMGARARVRVGADAIEELDFDGQIYTGMAREAGRCVAQGDDGLCDVHAEHGMDTKPVPCRQFPLRFHRAREAIHVSLLLACEGYDRGRFEASPDWPEREAEVRALLGAGGVAVALAWPPRYSAGLPVEEGPFWALQAELCALGGVGEVDARGWLSAALGRFEAAASAHADALREGDAVALGPQLAPAYATLRGDAWSAGALDEMAAALRARAEALRARDEPADSARLARLALVFVSLATPPSAATTLSPVAARLLADIVANDLPAAVAIGEVDVGLAKLARRVVVAEADMRLRATAAGRTEVSGVDATLALKLVARSDPDVTALGAALVV
jgi:Fe-S-cluster containining protein